MWKIIHEKLHRYLQKLVSDPVHQILHMVYFLSVSIEGHGLYAIMGAILAFVTMMTMIEGDGDV